MDVDSDRRRWDRRDDLGDRRDDPRDDGVRSRRRGEGRPADSYRAVDPPPERRREPPPPPPNRSPILDAFGREVRADRSPSPDLDAVSLRRNQQRQAAASPPSSALSSASRLDLSLPTRPGPASSSSNNKPPQMMTWQEKERANQDELDRLRLERERGILERSGAWARDVTGSGLGGRSGGRSTREWDDPRGGGGRPNLPPSSASSTRASSSSRMDVDSLPPPAPFPSSDYRDPSDQRHDDDVPMPLSNHPQPPSDSASQPISINFSSSSSKPNLAQARFRSAVFDSSPATSSTVASSPAPLADFPHRQDGPPPSVAFPSQDQPDVSSLPLSIPPKPVSQSLSRAPSPPVSAASTSQPLAQTSTTAPDPVPTAAAAAAEPPTPFTNTVAPLAPPAPVPLPSETYEKLVQVGEGTYGKVYKARNTATGRIVALKRIRMEGEKEGFPVTAMREIKLLQSLQHVNVVRLFEMMVSQGSSLCFSLLGSLFSSRLFLSVLAVPLSIS
jgi:hypothetical protein